MPKPNKLPYKSINTSAGGHVNAWPARLTQFAFVLALAIVFARATMLETVRDPFDIEFNADAVPRGPGPAASLVLDLLCCLPALLVLARRLMDPDYRLRFAWSHVAFALFALCTVVSSLWAADKFVALVTGAHVVAAATLLWATAQLVRTWLRLRLVAGVCFGLLLACLVHGLIYRYVDLPDLQRNFEENRESILKQRDFEPGSFQEKQFANKIINGEMIGFHVSPNAFAAVIVMLTVVSLGVAFQRFAHRDERAWAALIFAAAGLAVVTINWTHSKTTMATFVLALIAFGILGVPRVRAALATQSRKAYWIGLIVCVVGVFAVAGHGMYHGGLFPGRFNNSLHFRWRYWVAAERVFEMRPLLGVGWGNFGNHYTAHRLPEASEEVKDPHNLLVRAFVELGIVGGVLLIAWLARAGWELTRPIVPPVEEDVGPRDPAYSMRTAIVTMTAICGLALLINVAASVDFPANGALAFLETCKRLLYVCLLFAGALLATVRSTKRQELDGRPAPWVLYGCLIGVATLLVQNLIDLSLFEAGPLMVFALLVGAIGGVRAPATAECATRPVVAAAALAGASLAWGAAALFIVIPVVAAQNHAYEGDVDVRYGRTKAAASQFRAALREAPTNADYAFRAARALYMDRDLAGVREMLDAAIRIDPTLVKAYLMRAGMELMQPNPDAGVVRNNYDRAIELNPADTQIRLQYAAALEQLGLKKEAAEQYRTVLEFNDQLPIDEPERLPEKRVEEIRKKVAELSS
jgi:O-antigen ligase